MPKRSVELLFPFITTSNESLNNADSIANVLLNSFTSPIPTGIVLVFYDTLKMCPKWSFGAMSSTHLAL